MEEEQYDKQHMGVQPAGLFAPYHFIVEFCHEVTSAPVQQCRKDDRHCKKHKL
ncbi:hypothetical protein [Bacteroides cutis]|uniref:hypothetical protein n=1 Tax=Bacteroides cutis TaxID=2024197 RepID=UPI003522C29B